MSNIRAIRDTLPRAWDLANALVDLNASGTLATSVQSWFYFDEGHGNTGEIRIKAAIDTLLTPLSQNAKVEKLELAFQIDTGNTSYHEVTDIEDAIEFIQTYFQNPQAILARITPKKQDLPLDDEPAIKPSSSPI